LPGVPVLIGRKRVLSGRRACDEFAVDVCILDDAFQYWRLEKDLEIVLINATEPFGLGRVLPRGMLREPLRGLRRAHAAILTHADRAGESERAEIRKELLRRNPGLVIAEARHVPLRMRDLHTGTELPLESVAGERWVALSGLGQPESFERTLSGLGAEVLPARFPDHHGYTEGDLRAASDRVRAEGLAGIVTTEKDSVKIAPEWLDRTSCCILEIDLQFISGQDAIESIVRERVVRGS
jgi:tetraacyldisaccharide 4'-kinase